LPDKEQNRANSAEFQFQRDMNIDSVINFLLIAGVIQGFLFNFFTFFFRKKYSPVVLYLNLVVLFISLNNLQGWITANGYGSDHYFLKNMVVPWYVFVFPCFYNFLRNYLGVLVKTRNFLPLIFWLFMSETGTRAGIILYTASNGLDGVDAGVETYNVVEEIVNISVSGFLFVRSWQLVFSRQGWYRNFLSFDDIRWIKIFLVLGVSVILLWIFGLSLRATVGYNISIYYPLRLASSLLLYWIGYQGLYRYNIVQDRILIRKSMQTNTSLLDRRVVESNDRLQEKHLMEFQQIRSDIIQKGKYLDPDMTLEKLAQQQRVSSGHLSRIINLYGNKSFNDFINELRVEQAKVFLTDPAYDPYTILSIGLECGFNSKSTFYSAFKKFTSFTPSQFRSRLQ
jgi:AraC-like DNA-binding protein